MLHHRFPNGFTEIFMDETDREVSSLTDRAFRSLCIGDEAIYNDEFSYGFSPFSCHKPLVDTPSKKTHKEGSSKKLQQKQQHTNGGSNHQLGNQKKDVSSTVTSLLKAFGARDGGSEDTLIKNGYSWDKSALLSIQQELSEFSSDYHSNFSGAQFNHTKNSRDGMAKKSGKDGFQSSGKASKSKNDKSSHKLRKLNIKNFFLHSELSPFQSWRDLKRYPFGQGVIVTTILPSDNLPKWYDSPLYKELTESHRIETQYTEETEPCQNTALAEPTPPPLPAPAPSVPPKVLPKPFTALTERCSSEGGEAGAPWRKNRARAKSAVMGNKPGLLSPPHEGSKQADVSPLPGKKEVEVKAVEEQSSEPSTPFNISQLMTPVIPSRQNTETSEILQAVFAPSALDSPLRPGSEAKVTPEPPVKRESYKSIASSLLFNLKDNRKRVKSRYSPPKFRTSEVTDRSDQSPKLDPTFFKHSHASSDGTASGFSTPAILMDGQPVCSPVLEAIGGQTVGHERPISDDYLISNLLQSKREIAGSRGDLQENTGMYGGSPFANSKMNKSPLANKQSYPTLNLYKRASPETEMKTLNKDTLSVVNKGPALEHDKEPSPNPSDNTTRPAKNTTETKDFKDNKDKTDTTINIIRAAKEAISAAKNKALSSTQSESTKKQVHDLIEVREKDTGEQAGETKGHNLQSQSRTDTLDLLAVTANSKIRREPPPVPKRTNSKTSEKHQPKDRLTNGDMEEDDSVSKEKETVKQQGRVKHIFSSRQNNYIKSQRSVMSQNGEKEEDEEDYEPGEDDRFNAVEARYPEVTASRDIKDSEHIINDLNALKELERVRLGDREHTNNKMSGNNIDEEAKVKNDLISRELRNIKRGMLSMRGNTFAKRDVQAKREQEQSKQEAFEKIDSNVIVNKSRINDNYEKAKMALEEVITERAERLKSKELSSDEPDRNSEGKPVDDNYVARVQERKQARRDAHRAAEEKQNGVGVSGLRDEAVRERLEDLRDHNHIQQILSQTENNKSGVTVNMPGMNRLNAELNKVLATRSKSKKENNTLVSDISGDRDGWLNEKKQVNMNEDRDSNASSMEVSQQSSVESRENRTRERRDSRSEVPPVPPRIKKGMGKKEGSTEKDNESINDDIWQEGMKDMEGLQSIKERGQTAGQDSEVARETDVTQNKSSGQEMNTKQQRVTANAKTDELETRTAKEQSRNEQNNSKPQEQPKIKRKAPLRPDIVGGNKEIAPKACKSPTNTDRTKEKSSTEEPEELNTTLHKGTSAGEDVHEPDVHLEMISPSLENVNPVNQSPPDHSSQSSKSSYFSVESTLHRNPETDSAIYHSLDNLIDEMDEDQENSGEDLGKTEVKYYSVSDHDSEPEMEDGPAMSPTQPEAEDRKIRCKEGNKRILWSHVVKNDDNNQIPNVQSPPSLDICSPTNIQSPTLQSPPSSIFNSPTNHLSPALQSPPSIDVSSPINIQSPTLQSTTSSNVCSPINNLSPVYQSTPSSIVSSPTNNLSPALQSPPSIDVSSPINTLSPTLQSTTSSIVSSPTNNFSPALQSPPNSNGCSTTIEKPALFKVKDNTFNKRPVLHLPFSDSVGKQSYRESLSGSEKGEEDVRQLKDSVEIPLNSDTDATSEKPIKTPAETSEQMKHSSISSLSPSNQSTDNFKAGQYGAFLTVPQENDRQLGLSPSSEGMESLAASTADTADTDPHSSPAAIEEMEGRGSKVPSERSGSVCSGNDSQGPGRPPVVPPKSEKALLRAMKLTTRRIQKEEAKNKPAHKSRGSSKHGGDKRKSEKSEQEGSGGAEGRSSEDRHHLDSTKNHGHSDHSETTERSSHRHEKHGREPRTEQSRLRKSERPHGEGVEHAGRAREAAAKVHPGSSSAQRLGRNSTKHSHEKPEHRYHSGDRVISEVPVYKALPGDRHLVTDNNQLLHRSQSIDRYLSDKAEHRLRGSEKPVADRGDPRSQRIERSIIDELQQRGRVKERPARDQLVQRSRSIDTYISDSADMASKSTSLSRQSSYTDQLSRQSSMEHAIVTQSFPMTQRKLLQDPDSGQYFVVDMPIQVKTKTFFDPETGNYVQLPVQPPEGAVPKASTMEVLNTPLVLYHSFVPVPVSSIPAQQSTVQASQQEQGEFEQRLERARQKHSREGHPYLEPVYRPQEHMLGEFLGTEELDCKS